MTIWRSQKNDPKAATNTTTISFADSVMAVIVPSAKGATVQQEMQPAAAPVTQAARPPKRLTSQAAAMLFSSLHEPEAVTDEQKQLKAAHDGFAIVLEQARNYPDTYGFLPGERLADATLGEPIPVYRIALQDRERYTNQPVRSLLKPADEWVYPVILENRIRFLVQVRHIGQSYVRGIGSRALAAEYANILDRWPASEGFHPQLLTIPGQPFYYFTVPELPDQNITDTSRMFDLDPALSPATLVLSQWR